MYNRPQMCYTPDLQPEWLLALISIFIGCICITTTVILLATSHFDRNVIPYARWVGFAASKYSFIQIISDTKTRWAICIAVISFILLIYYC